MDDYFQQLGTLLEQQLAQEKAPQDRLAEIATLALEVNPSEEAIDANHMVDWVLSKQSLPNQVNFSYDFGQPPLTVFDSDHFYMEVLFWFPSRTAIHGHGFHGAFRVLSGHSLQTRYRFKSEAMACRGLQTGKLELTGFEVLEPGTVFTIEPRDGLLHSVLHLGRPSLTLVVRSRHIADSDQYTYSRCGLAHMHYLNKQRLKRQLDVIDVLRRAGSSTYQSRLIEFFREGNAHDRFMTMDYCRRVSESHAQLKDTLQILSAENDELSGLMQEAVFETVRMDSMWAGIKEFPSKPQRVEGALLELFGDRDKAEQAIEDFSGDLWDEWLAQWTAVFDV